MTKRLVSFTTALWLGLSPALSTADPWQDFNQRRQQSWQDFDRQQEQANRQFQQQQLQNQLQLQEQRQFFDHLQQQQQLDRIERNQRRGWR